MQSSMTQAEPLADMASVPAAARDRHFFEPGRKRILSIDGGGVRGVLALGFLERLETLLAEAAGRPVRLCDHFDLIGGTSTGAILATALALGYSAADIRSFYLRLGPLVFRRPHFRLPGWQSVFDAERSGARSSRLSAHARLIRRSADSAGRHA